MVSSLQDLVLTVLSQDQWDLHGYTLQEKRWLAIRRQLRLRDDYRDRYSSGLVFLDRQGSHEAIIENWTFGFHRDLLNGMVNTYQVPLLLDDHAPGVTAELKTAGLNPIFVYQFFHREDHDDHGYGYKKMRVYEGSYAFEYDDYYGKSQYPHRYRYGDRDGYAPMSQPKTTHVAFFTETDAIAAQAVLDIMYEDRDAFAKAS